MKSYRWYLFDADGTLIDTTELIFRCFEYSLKRFAGRVVNRDDIMGQVGLTLRAQFERYLGPLDDERYREIGSAHMSYQHTIYPDHLRAFPEVPDTLRRLVDRGAVCGVVTSRMPDSLALYLDVTGLRSYFELLITPADTVRHKPHPEPVLLAMQRLGARPDQSVYIGDAEFDISSGVAAGIDTIFVQRSHNRALRLPTEPAWIVDGLEELCVGDTPAVEPAARGNRRC
jgi:pyrophosphatase PpaX